MDDCRPDGEKATDRARARVRLIPDSPATRRRAIIADERHHLSHPHFIIPQMYHLTVATSAGRGLVAPAGHTAARRRLTNSARWGTSCVECPDYSATTATRRTTKYRHCLTARRPRRHAYSRSVTRFERLAAPTTPAIMLEVGHHDAARRDGDRRQTAWRP